MADDHALKRGLGGLLGGVAALAMFRAVGLSHYQNFVLDLGSIFAPRPRYSQMLLVWSVFGSVAALLFTLGIARLAARPGAADGFQADWTATDDRRWVRGACVIGFALTTLVHWTALGGAPLVDDESAYRFMAELLVSGRVTAESPPMKLFFDRAFMINDGALYAKYLLGWPALLAPGMALGTPWLMNPIYFALTVPPLYRVLQRTTTTGWARGGIVLFISAPMLLVGAATQMSHTSCVMALAWALHWALMIRDGDPPKHAYWALALALGTAFFIRPSSAVGIGAPLAWVALRAALRLPGPMRLRALLQFGLPAVLFVTALLLVNRAQTGSPWTLAYQQMTAYAEANEYRFAGLAPSYSHYFGTGPVRMLGTTCIGLLRLGFALFGWPTGLLLLVVAVGAPRTGLIWAAGLSFLVVHLPISDPGVDTFGPVHFFEVALPIVILSTAAFARLSSMTSNLGAGHGMARTLSPALLAGLVLSGWFGYAPIRFGTLIAMSQDIQAPLDAVAEANLGPSVIFSPRPFAAPCIAFPATNFVFFRPNNDPDLENETLWVNHIDVDQDRKLMAHFPGRRGFILTRSEDCTLQLTAVDDPDATRIPPGEMFTR